MTDIRGESKKVTGPCQTLNAIVDSGKNEPPEDEETNNHRVVGISKLGESELRV